MSGPNAERDARIEAGRRLLIVDDEPEMVASLRDIAEMHGWATDGAASGEEALSLFDRTNYDAVVMDIRMPGISGVEALRRMKERRPGVPVILITAHTAPELIAEAVKAGVTQVLSKPVPVRVLFRRLEQVGEDQGSSDR